MMLFLQSLYETKLKHQKPLISVPLYWSIPRKIKPPVTATLNLNWYRNAHYQDLNKVKKYVHDWVKVHCIKQKTPFIPAPFEMACVIHSNDHRSDLMNWAAIAEKCVLDALQDCKVINNDYQKHYTGCAAISGECDKINPRADFYLLTAMEEVR